MAWDDNYDGWKTNADSDEYEYVFCVDSLGEEIYYGDTYYDINGMILSKDSLDDLGSYLNEEGETFECSYCGKEYHIDSYDELYYSINGDTFCYECATDCELEADD